MDLIVAAALSVGVLSPSLIVLMITLKQSA
jgi:hypothetical protein